MAVLRKTGTVPSQVVNHKMTRSYPVPKSFFIGAKVARQFGRKWVEGTIDRLDQDENDALWHVVYSDFDEEQLDKIQMCDAVVYHPLLDVQGDLKVPRVGTYVWYSHNQQPYLGQVVSIDPSVSRPVVVQRFRPQANAESLPRAKFQRAVDPDTGKAILSHLTLPQVQLQFDSLTARGYLSAKDRRKLQDRLTM